MTIVEKKLLSWCKFLNFRDQYQTLPQTSDISATIQALWSRAILSSSAMASATWPEYRQFQNGNLGKSRNNSYK